MMSRRKFYIGSSALLAGVVIGGYLLFSQARQGGGGEELVQAPMNIQAPVPPAFIMALDDSTSMFSETISDSYDGGFFWNNATTARTFYDSSTGAPWLQETANFYVYYTLFPYTYPNSGRTARNAIPPFDAYGFARSPDVNPFYFDPRVEYEPWKTQDGCYYGISEYGIPDSTGCTGVAVRPESAPVDARLPSSLGVAPNNHSSLRYDLTQDIRPASPGLFLVTAGMVIPKGTEIYVTVQADTTRPNGGGTGYPCKTSPYAPSNLKSLNAGWQTLSNDLTVAGTTTSMCELGIRYFAPTFYLKSETVGPPSLPGYGYAAVPTSINSPAGGMPGVLWKYEIKRANFDSDASYTAAIQNFARWFSFYRVRRDALIAGATNALTSVNTMRIGVLNITEHANYNNPNSASRMLKMYDMDDEADRIGLFDKLFAMDPVGATPNVQAVQSAGIQFTRTDNDAPIQLSCQKNATMLFTDGYSNDYGSSSIKVGNVDAGLPAPFADGNSNTMADVVAKYYLANLRPDMDSAAVPVPDECSVRPLNQKLDCRTDPHMNFHSIVMGTKGSLYGKTYIPNESDYSIITPDPFVSFPTWPTPESGTASAVDDLWHATLTGRGLMINASRPEQISSAMNSILSNVSGGATTSGTMGLTGARIGTGSFTVEPTYISGNSGTDWYSYLRAYKITRNRYTGKLTNTLAWEASTLLAARSEASRNIWFASPSGTVTPTVKEFSSSNITSLDDLCSDSLAFCASSIDGLGVTKAQAVSYLRGSQDNEGELLRTRTTVLGDIVNSSPIISSGKDDYGYRSLRTVDGNVVSDGYAAYLTSKSSKPSMVYVGANDGMLHAFDENGAEKFAYIPQTSLSHMGNLLFPYRPNLTNSQVFEHRYYVDGLISISDAKVSGSWKTMLVGASGAGGRSVFALDITNPNSFSDSSVQWEISDNHSDDVISKNIGYVLGQPVIVPVNAGGHVSWKAIFGNGYNSENQKAALYVVDMDTHDISVVIAEETGLAGEPNGLGNIVVVDRYIGDTMTRGSDGYADTVYAADQNGAIWKFKLNSATPSVGSDPVFIARDPLNNSRQAITGGLEAALGSGGGVMIYFGTGSYSFTSDRTDQSVQTFYAVLDREESGAATLTRSNLTKQSILSESADGSRAISNNSGSSLGWYVDMGVATSGGNVEENGERVVGYPIIESGIVFFTSYQPTGGGCSGSGVNRLYGLNAVSGGAAMSLVKIGGPDGTTVEAGTGSVKLDSSGSAAIKDVVSMSTPRVSPLDSGATAEEIAAAGAARCSMVIQVSGASPMYLPRPCGRQSWRQIR